MFAYALQHKGSEFPQQVVEALAIAASLDTENNLAFTTFLGTEPSLTSEYSPS